MPSIEVTSLLEYLPHRAPMVWVNEVTWSETTRGGCRIVISDQALYWGPRGVLQCAPIEWMAQTAAFCSASRGAQTLKDAFLVGLKDARLSDLSELKPGSAVDVEVSIIKELPPLTLVAGEVIWNGKVIAKATLKLFGK